MQRLHRYGTVAFTLCLLASIFHIIALSYNTWLTAACNKCSDTDVFKYWTVSIGQRCYQIQMSQIFSGAQNDSTSDRSRKLLRTEFCLPKRHLHARRASYVSTCLEAIEEAPHLVCSLRQYDPTKCKCDFTAGTKAVIALAVISCICLGTLVILTHFTSYVSHDTFINCLVRGGLAAMIVSAICMFSILIIMGTSKHEDSKGIDGNLLIQDFQDDIGSTGNMRNISSTYQQEDYTVNIGWSFGLEIVALVFTISTAVIYGLMLTAKRRPE